MYLDYLNLAAIRHELASELAGAHVIYCPGGAGADPSALETAAGLAAYHSAAQEQARVQVDYTELKHVRAIQSAGPGMVTYRHEGTIIVEPMAPSELGSV
ncbi:MAG: hypothetical protein ACP5G7_11615 [Anaerolineae bacterium]